MADIDAVDVYALAGVVACRTGTSRPNPMSDSIRKSAMQNRLYIDASRP